MSSEGFLYEGLIDADAVEEAFWAAAEAIFDDETVHGMDMPHFDRSMQMVDCSGCGMPPQFWEHMARALAQGEK